MTIDPLFVDVYAGDGPKDWDRFCAAGPPWHGVIFKCSEGNYYRPREYAAERQRFLAAAGGRYGHDLFDGAFHYLNLGLPGRMQADYAWTAILAAGGELAGTIPLAVDVERGGKYQAKRITRLMIEDVAGEFAARYTQLTGRQATLYGGELLRAYGIKDRIGCSRSWVALYGPRLAGGGETTQSFLARTGTDVQHTALWQYCAADLSIPPSGPPGYPREAPGCGRVDISAWLLGGLDGIRSTLVAPRDPMR